MDECVKAGDVCPSALHCLKQGDGSYACGCDAKGFKVVGERDARNCAGKSFSYVMDDHASFIFYITIENTDWLLKESFWYMYESIQNTGSGSRSSEQKTAPCKWNVTIIVADIDECKEKKFSCPMDRVCKNRPGGYECVCKKGLRLDYDGKCVRKYSYQQK